VLELLGRQAKVAATFTADIADRAAVEALPKAVAARLGPVDALIN
jgi:NAD(P)-dependent dehydrogenase (short-subunit alcohol dehydrogenase family)